MVTNDNEDIVIAIVIVDDIDNVDRDDQDRFKWTIVRITCFHLWSTLLHCRSSLYLPYLSFDRNCGHFLLKSASYLVLLPWPMYSDVLWEG